jgi:glycopeptide antibiotics resistance protein
MLALPVTLPLRRLGLAMVIVTLVAGVIGTQWPFEYRLTRFALHRHWQKIEWAWFPHHGRRIDVEDLVINLVMLIPLGFGWALWRRAARIRVVLEAVVLGAVTGIGFEVAQLPTRYRSTQFADAWRNTLSCMIGCVAGLVFVALVDRWRRRLLATDAQRHDG